MIPPAVLGLDKPLYCEFLGKDVAPYLECLCHQLIDSDFTGYDPGSYHCQKMRRIKSSGCGLKDKIWNLTINNLVKKGGFFAITLFDLPKVRSTKAIAVTLVGLDELQDRYPNILKTHGSFLVDRLYSCWQKRHQAWTPDFDYTIKGVNVSEDNAGTINSIFAAEALWRWYLRTKDQKIAVRIIETANGLVNCLPRYEHDDKCCFSYNPSVKYYVHNANLFLALLIARASILSPGFAHSYLLEPCLEYSLSDFETHGLLRYAGPPTPHNTVDNYHTGYVLRTLQSLVPYLENESLQKRCYSIIEQGVHYYASSFVTNKGVFKFAKEKGPIQAHSLAEALLMYVNFASQFPDAFGDAYRRGCRRAFDVLWDKKKKYFSSEMWLLGSRPLWRNTIPMPRWAWAWMFMALASLVNVEGDNL